MRLTIRISKGNPWSAFFAAIVGLATTNAFGWGGLGHETLGVIASQLTSQRQDFWTANASHVGVLINVPDRKWKSETRKENPTHYFSFDGYFTDARELSTFPRAYAEALRRYKSSQVLGNGTAPWRVQQLYEESVKAFRAGDHKTGLQMAGVMAHYIADLVQPLHVTKNYNGQKTGNHGIHSFFETTNVSDLDTEESISEVKARAAALLQRGELSAFSEMATVEIGFAIVADSAALATEVLETDSKWGRKAEGAKIQRELALERIARGAAILALVFDRISEEGGITLEERIPAVPPPSWVPASY